eukprot:2955817-Amphidinium_carterae.1
MPQNPRTPSRISFFPSYRGSLSKTSIAFPSGPATYCSVTVFVCVLASSGLRPTHPAPRKGTGSGDPDAPEVEWIRDRGRGCHAGASSAIAL